MLVVSLGSVVALTYVGLLSFSHANIYPSGADQVQAGNDGAPQSLGQGWTPPVSPTDASQGRTAIQGFPATSAAQLRSMVQTFNKLNVPGYAERLQTTTPAPPPLSQTELNSFIDVIGNLTSHVLQMLESSVSSPQSSSSLSSSSDTKIPTTTFSPFLSWNEWPGLNDHYLQHHQSSYSSSQPSSTVYDNNYYHNQQQQQPQQQYNDHNPSPNFNNYSPQGFVQQSYEGSSKHSSYQTSNSQSRDPVQPHPAQTVTYAHPVPTQSSNTYPGSQAYQSSDWTGGGNANTGYQQGSNSNTHNSGYYAQSPTSSDGYYSYPASQSHQQLQNNNYNQPQTNYQHQYSSTGPGNYNYNSNSNYASSGYSSSNYDYFKDAFAMPSTQSYGQPSSSSQYSNPWQQNQRIQRSTYNPRGQNSYSYQQQTQQHQRTSYRSPSQQPSYQWHNSPRHLRSPASLPSASQYRPQLSSTPQYGQSLVGTGLDKQAAISYLQNLQRLQSRFKTLFAPPQPPNIPLPVPLRSSDLLPPAPSPPRIPTPPRLPTPPVRPPPLKAPMIPPWALQQNQPPPPPQLRPPQPKPLSPSALSPFVGPPPAGNKPAPAPPQRAQQYVPPPRAMAGGGECSGRFVPGQLCCDGIVNPLPAGGNQQWGCCHKGIYNINTQVCCGDVPVPKPTSGPPMLCCGMALYDPRTQLCCDKFPVPNQGGTLKCCRKQAYDPVNQMCCGESVKPRPPHQRNMDCCGKHMYNPMTHLCCEEGNTFLKSPMTQCCGKNTFMPTTQQCCFGDALPKGAMCMAK